MRNTMVHSMTGMHARWAVLWIAKGKWHCKEFEDDFTSATELYVKVQAAGRKGATLLCRNVGFPPPAKMRAKMGAANRRGYLWCPYCRAFRRFKRHSGYFVESVFVPEPNNQCPVCGVMDTNHHVRKHNPSLSPRNHYKEATNGAGSKRRSSAGRAGRPSKLTDEQRAAKRERARKRRERAAGP